MKNSLIPSVRFLTTLLAGAIIATLGGCASKPGIQAKPEVKIQFVSNAQQISQVVAALETGDTKRARNLLKSMQKRDPTNVQLQTLKMSLEANPTSILGTKSFAYTVKSGDRMTALSNRFLGDPLKFFLLARFNGLKDAQVTPGQIIQIPGNAPLADPVPLTRTRPKPAQSIAPTRPTAAPIALKANPALATSLRGRGLAALNRGNITQAVAILRRAQAADPANNIIRRDLERAERLSALVEARK